MKTQRKFNDIIGPYTLILSLLFIFCLIPKVKSKILYSDDSLQVIITNDEIITRNELIEFRFSKSNFNLVGLIHRKTNFNFKVNNSNLNSLFTIQLVNNEKSFILSNTDLSHLTEPIFNWTLVNTTTPPELHLLFRWQNFSLSKNNAETLMNFTFSIIIKENDPLTTWNAMMDFEQSKQNSYSLSLWNFNLDALKHLGSNDPQNDYLVSSWAFGNLYRNPSLFQKGFTNRYPSSSQTMQWTSYYHTMNSLSDSPGLYFAAHDPKGNTKDFGLTTYLVDCLLESFCPFDLNIQVITPNAGRIFEHWNLSFPIIIGVFEGDWWDASQIYRTWAIQNADWTQRGPIFKNHSNCPSWFFKNTFWVNTGWTPVDENFDPNTGNPDIVLAKIEKLQNALGIPFFVHWYVWDEIENFDTHYPQYFPAKPGFKDAVAKLQDQNITIFPYINGRLFDMSIELWYQDRADRYCVKSSEEKINGSLSEVHEFYESEAVFCVMCPSTEYWQTIISNTVSHLFNYYEVAGIYIDQIAAAGAQYCFDPSHGHSTGGGTFWRDGYERLLHLANQSNITKPIVVEENAETYMDMVSGFLTIEAQIFDSSIPLYASVYGGYYTAIGSIFDLADFYPNPDLFAAKMSETFLWGIQLGWFSLGNMLDITNYLLSPQYQAEVNFLKLLVNYRLQSIEFTQFGRMMRPFSLPINVPIVPGILKDLPVVMQSSWKSLQREALGIFVVNADSTNSYPIQFDLDLQAYSLPKNQTFQLFQVDQYGNQVLKGKVQQVLHWNQTLKSRDVLYLLLC